MHPKTLPCESSQHLPPGYDGEEGYPENDHTRGYDCLERDVSARGQTARKAVGSRVDADVYRSVLLGSVVGPRVWPRSCDFDATPSSPRALL